MMSNQLYFNWRLTKDRIVQNLWISGIFFLSCLFTLPIYSALTLQRYLDDISGGYASKIDVYDYIQQLVGQENSFLKFFIVITAMLMGCAYFCYMHSKNEVDFYHSLPVSRGKLFLSNFFAGNISFAISYIFNLILSLAIISMMGFGYGIDFGELIKTVCINFIFFNLIFSISIFAGIITGTKITHVLMTLVVLEYSQLFFILTNEYLSYFFRTFYSNNIFNEKIIISLSPITSYFSYIDNQMLIFQTMGLIIIIVMNIYLFIIRPSETTGKSIVNLKLKSFVRYATLLICTMSGGLIFYDIGRSKFWLIFGLVFSSIVSYCVIESILNFNMESMWKNKKKLIIFLAIFSGIFGILDMDIMGYDKRIPDKEEIENVFINPINFDMSVPERTEEYTGEHQSFLSNIKISNKESIDAILEIANMSIASQVDEYDEEYYQGAYFELAVKFNLKNGKSMTRKYSYMKKEEALPIFAKIFDTQEFKYKYYPIFNLNEEDIVKSSIEHIDLMAENGNGLINREIKSKEVNSAILKLLKEDVLMIKSKDLISNVPVATMIFYLENKEVHNKYRFNQEPEYIEIQVPIYSQYKNSLDIINKYSYINSNSINAEQVKYIEVYEYDKQNESEKDKAVKTISNKSEVEEILDNHIINYNLYLNPFIITDSNKWAIVYFKGNVSSSRDLVYVKPVSIN